MKKEFKYDCHIHTKEGSIDGVISIVDVIKQLKDKEYDGMIVTDHNSYKGYKYYKDNLDNLDDDFIVIKGIEYDTSDAGHMLIVMPSGSNLNILTCRGLSLNKLIEIVHTYGGVIGVAHPYHERFLAFGKTGKYKYNQDILNKIDFIEGLNTTEYKEDNKKAQDLAKKYNLPITGGSDSHNEKSLGHGYTLFDNKLNNEDDFIAYIKEKKNTKVGGKYYKGTTRYKLGKFNIILVYLYGLWNLFMTIIYWPIRVIEIIKLKKRHALA